MDALIINSIDMCIFRIYRIGGPLVLFLGASAVGSSVAWLRRYFSNVAVPHKDVPDIGLPGANTCGVAFATKSINSQFDCKMV